MKKKLSLMLCLALAVALLTASGVFAAALGYHDDASGNPCKRCHNTASGTPALRGWNGTPPVGVPGWGTKPISNLCYFCHNAAQPLGATNQTANAFAAGSHGYTKTVALVPPLPEGTDDLATITNSGLPYVSGLQLECTSCHNVHVVTSRPFNQRADVQAMCVSCHAGRVNNDSATTYAGTLHGYTTHPTRQNMADTAVANIKSVANMAANLKVTPIEGVSGVAWQLGGHLRSATAFDCQTCHSVHGTSQGLAAVNDLLAINNATAVGTGSALCEGCHYGGYAGEQVGITVAAAGEYSDHPLDANNNKAFYPTGVALPATWIGAGNSNGDRGAQPFVAIAQPTPACSSCHDTHGGMAATQLLRGPSRTFAGATTWTFSYDEWCFVCHTAAQVIPNNHHSVINNLNLVQGDEMDSQLSCGDCHGALGSTNWKAHNGFWVFAVAISATDSAFCQGCHVANEPLSVDTTGLKNIAGTLVNPAPMPASHGTDRNPGHAANGSSHQVNDPADGTNLNLIKKVSAWAASGGISEWGAGANEAICESCHNILTNGVSGGANQNLRNGWKGNILLQPYEDDLPGVAAGEGTHDFYTVAGVGAGATGDALCRGCHASTAAPTDFVHNPFAHTQITSGYTYAAGTNPYGRATSTVMTTPIDSTNAATCPEVSTADATGSPNQCSYPAANAVDCDSCHRPHSADPDSYEVANNRYLILEVTDANFGTTICAQCHNTDVQCTQ